MSRIFDCLYCGLPLPICSCSTPDAVYYQVETPRLDEVRGRSVSPAEGLSDYAKANLFIDAFLLGRDGYSHHSFRERVQY